MKIVSKIVTAVLTFGLISVTLCGCKDITIHGLSGKLYDSASNMGIRYDYDEKEYYVGGATLQDFSVENLYIDWIAGDVSISYHDSKDIIIEETSRYEMNEDEKLRYKAEGSSLYIKYCGAVPISNNLSKSLTVTLPEGTVFGDFNVNVVSSNLKFDSVETANFVFDGVSGELICDSIDSKDGIKIDTVSGKSVISGACTGNNLNFNSTSGSITINGSALLNSVDIDTVSGDATIAMEKMCNVDFDATSGDLVLKVPEDASFTLESDSVSGDVSIDCEARIKDDIYTVGDGQFKVDADTVSGDVTINQ